MKAFSMRDLQFVVKFHQEVSGDRFRHLVHALCPSIYGHELVKVLFAYPALALTVFVLQSNAEYLESLRESVLVHIEDLLKLSWVSDAGWVGAGFAGGSAQVCGGK